MGRGRRLKTTHFATLEDAKALAERVVKAFPEGAVIALYGELGAGKTTLAKEIGRAALGLEAMASPTYTYLHQYPGLIHFDVWRLQGVQDFCMMGFEEFLHQGGWVIIEWADKIEALLPEGTVRITLKNSQARIDHDQL